VLRALYDVYSAHVIRMFIKNKVKPEDSIKKNHCF